MLAAACCFAGGFFVSALGVFELNGVTYGHILNCRTGWPVATYRWRLG